MEETTGAVPLTIVVMGSVDIILASERRFKTVELNALRLFGVTFRFSDFVNHA
jgi:hypothetical protein